MSAVRKLKIERITTSLERIDYRTPMKFGGRVVADVTIADAQVELSTDDGRSAVGRGSMTMGNAWSWPSTSVPSSETLAAMIELFERTAEDVADVTTGTDPFDLGAAVADSAHRRAEHLRLSRVLAEPMPRLAVSVAVSPIDAAIHDAFGRLLGRSSFACLDRGTLGRDLGSLLDPEFAGLELASFVSSRPAPTLPLYHLVGALDPLDDGELTMRLDDGLPETLGEWIVQDGLDHLKIKLAGDDLEWDVARVLKVDAVATRTWSAASLPDGVYSLDFNERCADVGYVLEFLERIRSERPSAYDRIQYLEQPTHRDLAGPGRIPMHRAAALKPVVIDESLLDLESLRAARELGYSGIALKACKGQSGSLLMAAAAKHYGMFLCVQDLTCVGASFLHSASLAAHIPGIAAIEGNGRQYCPKGNAAWTHSYPGMFAIRRGRVVSAELAGIGLGFVWPES